VLSRYSIRLLSRFVLFWISSFAFLLHRAYSRLQWYCPTFSFISFPSLLLLPFFVIARSMSRYLVALLWLLPIRPLPRSRVSVVVARISWPFFLTRLYKLLVGFLPPFLQ
jgi:hypothetical protein